MSIEQYQRDVNSIDKEIATLEKKKAEIDKKYADLSKKIYDTEKPLPRGHQHPLPQVKLGRFPAGKVIAQKSPPKVQTLEKRLPISGRGATMLI